MRQSQQKPRAKHNCAEDCQQIILFSRSRLRCKWTLWYRAFAERVWLWAFRFYRKWNEPQQMCIKSRGKYVCMQAHTAPSPASPLHSVPMPTFQKPNPAPVDILPHDNTGFQGKLYKVPFSCSLYYEWWFHETPAQRGSLLWFQVPSQNIIPLIPYPAMGCPDNAGDISPGRQFSTDGQCLFSLLVPEQITHSLAPILHCLGESGWVRLMP